MRLPKDGWNGRDIDKDRIILATTSNHTKDLTGLIVVTSIQRNYNADTFTETTPRQLGWER